MSGEGFTLVSPVCGEFLLDRGDDQLLHLLICLGDQVHSGALDHDLDFILQSSPDNLQGKTNKKIFCLLKPSVKHLREHIHSISFIQPT